tara:strand:+ start:64 stop:582 length:519 start_codon:yes stop_codon:yes gene_type:complete
MPKSLINAIAVMVIGGLCVLALTETYRFTRAPIEDNRIRQAQALLSELLGREAPTDLRWVEGVTNACGDWHFVRGAKLGYSGPIEFLALLDHGHISMRVTRHQETRGIADFIDHNKDDYLPNLDNSPIDAWAEIDNISGATITHKALRAMAGQARTQRRDAREKENCEAANA